MVDAGRSHAAGVGEGARQRIVKLCACVKAAVPDASGDQDFAVIEQRRRVEDAGSGKVA